LVLDLSDRFLLFVFGVSIAIVFGTFLQGATHDTAKAVFSLVILFGVACCIQALGYMDALLQAFSKMTRTGARVSGGQAVTFAELVWGEMKLLLVAAALFICAANPRLTGGASAKFVFLILGAIAVCGYVAKSAGWQAIKWLSIFGCVVAAGLFATLIVFQWHLQSLISTSPELLDKLREVGYKILKIIFPSL